MCAAVKEISDWLGVDKVVSGGTSVKGLYIHLDLFSGALKLGGGGGRGT